MDSQRLLENTNDALENISLGLLLLDQYDDELSRLIGPKVVDIAARMNAQYCSLEKHLAPLKEKIKAEALDGVKTDETLMRGQVYQARVLRIVKSVLDTDRVRTYLGKNLPRFIKERKETQLTFQIKG